MTDLAPHPDRRLVGIALMCCALACFSCLDTTAKYLSRELPTLEIVWARYASAFALALIASNPVRHPGLMRTKRPRLQVLRSGLLVGSTLLNFFALRFLQLDEALSIIFSSPFIVAILSGPVLGERIEWQRWVAISIGFVGVLVITRPGPGGMHPAAFLTLASVFCYGLYLIVTRLLSRSDSSETTLFYTNTVGTVLMTVLVPFVWAAPSSWFTAGLMVVMGVFGGIGHWILIVAHRHAPAAVLAPFVYTQIVWVVLLGYFVFGDVPNHWTLAGSSIVIAAGLYLIHRERVGHPKS